MTIVINYTSKSGAIPETITDVKSYKHTSLYSIEVIFNDGKIESFYAVESVKELSEPEVVIYELSLNFMNDDSGRWDNKSIAYSKSIDKLKQKAIDSNQNIYDQQWIQYKDYIELSIGNDDYYIIKQIELI